MMSKDKILRMLETASPEGAQERSDVDPAGEARAPA